MTGRERDAIVAFSLAPKGCATPVADHRQREDPLAAPARGRAALVARRALTSTSRVTRSGASSASAVATSPPIECPAAASSPTPSTSSRSSTARAIPSIVVCSPPVSPKRGQVGDDHAEARRQQRRDPLEAPPGGAEPVDEHEFGAGASRGQLFGED